MATDSRQTGEKERVALRRREVIKLRCKGHTLDEITDIWNTANPEFPVSRSSVANDVKESLRKAVEENKLDTNQYRELLLMRLDSALKADKFQSQIEKGNLLAIDRLIKLTERYAKLLGADAPTKVAQTDPTGEKEASGLSDQERADRIREILRRAEERKVEAEIEQLLEAPDGE
jgi:hypothetical protein